MFREGDQLGPYTLVSKIGSGAFGTVWLADRVTQIATTRVALKLPSGDDVDVDAIRHEANTWVQASGHPNVVPIIEANIYEGQVVIASEYIAEGSLEDWLNQNDGRAPSIDAAVDMTRGILAGLEHLHSRHIIHRDLKPANLLIQGETPRLADFGISRVLNTSSRTAMAAGTPSYMAPEAFDGKRTEQTDLWAVGVMLYQMLMGRLPFPQQDMTSLIGAIVARNPDPLPAYVPAPLQGVINCALAKNPAQRYRSASEMRTALRNAIKQVEQGRGQPVPRPTAPPPTVPIIQQPQTPYPNQGAGAPPFPTMPARPQPTAPRPMTPTMPVNQSYPPQPYPQQSYPQQSYPPGMYQPVQKKGTSPMVYVLIAVVAVLVIGGGIFAFMKLGSNNSNKSSNTNNSIAVVTNTNSNNSNANANANQNKNNNNQSSGSDLEPTTNSYNLRAASIQLETPVGWTRQRKGDRVLVNSPDENVSIVFWVGNDYTLDAGMKTMQGELSRVMTNIQPEDDPETGTLGGMPASSQSGKGNSSGGEVVEYSSYVVMGSKPLMLFIFANPGQYEQHLPDMKRFISSIRRAS